MKSDPIPAVPAPARRGMARWIGTCLGIGAVGTLLAFPPAPHHTLFGVVRNQWGDPLDVGSAIVFVQTTNGVSVSTPIIASTVPGVNYRVEVPMDAGISGDLYQPTALRRNDAFRLKVKLGATTYLPLEMAVSPTPLGRPAESTRIDLTLGEDTDNDGLPDAWERAIITLLGGTLAGITPDGDADRDGISNLNEYLAGTYAFDPNDGFVVSLVSLDPLGSVLEFLAVRGRTYSVQASTDMQTWTPVSFRLLTGQTVGPLQNTYSSTDVRILRLEVPAQPGGETNRFFKAMVQ